MKPSITEGKLKFEFPADWEVSKLDAWSFYRGQIHPAWHEAKAVDILALAPAPDMCTWMIEVKDYREHGRSKLLELSEEFATKVRHSLVILVGARLNANNDSEKQTSIKALGFQKIRVALHLEQPAKHSKLFPRAIDPSKIEQRLKQLLKPIAPHPRVYESSPRRDAPWTVE